MVGSARPARHRSSVVLPPPLPAIRPMRSASPIVMVRLWNKGCGVSTPTSRRLMEGMVCLLALGNAIREGVQSRPAEPRRESVSSGRWPALRRRAAGRRQGRADDADCKRSCSPPMVGCCTGGTIAGGWPPLQEEGFTRSSTEFTRSFTEVEIGASREAQSFLLRETPCELRGPPCSILLPFPATVTARPKADYSGANKIQGGGQCCPASSDL